MTWATPGHGLAESCVVECHESALSFIERHSANLGTCAPAPDEAMTGNSYIRVQRILPHRNIGTQCLLDRRGYTTRE